MQLLMQPNSEESKYKTKKQVLKNVVNGSNLAKQDDSRNVYLVDKDGDGAYEYRTVDKDNVVNGREE